MSVTSSSKIAIDERLKQSIEKDLPNSVSGGAVAFGVLVVVSLSEERNLVFTAPTPMPDGKFVWTVQDPPDEMWIIEHAKQVSRMLIGGCQVAGIYANAPKQYLDKYSGSIEYIMKLMHKSGTAEPLLLTWQQSSGNNSRRPSWARFLPGKRASFESEKINFKYQQLPSLRSKLCEVTWVVQTHPVQPRLGAQAHSANAILKQLCEDILDIEKSRLDDSILVPHHDNSDASASAISSFQFCEDFSTVYPDSGDTGDGGSYLASGAVCSRALVATGGADATAAATNLRKDVLSSLNVRLDLLTSELEKFFESNATATAKGSAARGLFALPRRVFFSSPPPVSFPLCDYVAIDENLDAVRERCRDLLGFPSSYADSMSIHSAEVHRTSSASSSTSTKEGSSSQLESTTNATTPSQKPKKENLSQYAGLFLLLASLVGSAIAVIVVLLLR